MTNENNVSKKSFSLTDKLIIVALLGWILFGGGYSLIKSAATTKNLRQVTTTIGTGVQRLADKDTAANPAPASGRHPTTAAAKPGAGMKLPPPPALTAGVSAGAAGQPVATAQPTAQPTAVPSATPATVASLGADVAEAPAGAVAPAPAFLVPLGAHTNINPDGSFTIDNGQTRYYPDSNGVIVEVRLAGSEDWLENVVEPTAVPTAAPTSGPAPTRGGSPCRRGCPKR